MKKSFGTLHRVFFLFLVFAVALPAFVWHSQASAQEYQPDPTPVQECGDYAYKLYSDGTLEIVDYSGQESDIVIPTELDGNRVTMVGSDAFDYCEMASLTIPEGIIVTGRAFQYCVITDALTLPAGIDISVRAFEYAELPKAVVIPEGAVIGGDCFSYCEKLETLFVEPSAVVKGSAFSYSEDLKTLVCASGSEIADRAFYSSRSLAGVILCGDVKLGDKPFPYCEQAELRPEAEAYYASELEKAIGLQEKVSGSNVQTGPVEQKTDKRIGEQEAVIIALDDAGLSPRSLSYLKVELMQNWRGFYYEVVFNHGAYKYEYEIEAYSGDILSAKRAK